VKKIVKMIDKQTDKTCGVHTTRINEFDVIAVQTETTNQFDSACAD